jgi:hypothetical protein
VRQHVRYGQPLTAEDFCGPFRASSPALGLRPGLRRLPRLVHPVPRQDLVALYDLKKVAAEDAWFIFPVLGSKEGVMSDNTLTKALRTLGYTGDVMTANGFRSMASTLLNASSLTPRDKVRAAYNYAEHPPERRRMMQGWADYLDDLRDAARTRKSKPGNPSRLSPLLMMPLRRHPWTYRRAGNGDPEAP